MVWSMRPRGIPIETMPDSPGLGASGANPKSQVQARVILPKSTRQEQIWMGIGLLMPPLGASLEIRKFDT